MYNARKGLLPTANRVKQHPVVPGGTETAPTTLVLRVCLLQGQEQGRGYSVSKGAHGHYVVEFAHSRQKACQLHLAPLLPPPVTPAPAARVRTSSAASTPGARTPGCPAGPGPPPRGRSAPRRRPSPRAPGAAAGAPRARPARAARVSAAAPGRPAPRGTSGRWRPPPRERPPGCSRCTEG